MEIKKVMEKVNQSPKGAFASVSWARPIKTKKEFNQHTIVKHSYGTALRFGVCYDNMASTKEGRENGTKPAENAGLIGRKWIIPNVLLSTEKTGKTLLRVSLANNSKFNTYYTIDGKTVDKSKIIDMVYKSELSSHSTNVFDINIDYIEEIR